ncbi:hypothetical protein ZWY2020_034112 [Hordeum vulgare]|nr:hypothetical protein ZWY2020_034112 [Hordeum vulgare]
MDAQNKEVDALVQNITGLHAAIAKVPSLSPSPDVDALFTDLVTACVPPSPVDVTKLGSEAQEMQEGLIRLCSEAEGKLEAHYSDMLAAFDNPLDHLGMFPYYSNYINLSKLEYELLARYVPGGIAPARVAFIGSGPLPFSSYVLAARHLPDAMSDNYDLCGAANDRASKLFRADTDVGAHMSFHTANVADLTGELAAYDVVFLAALVGMAAEDKAKGIAHMADGAALVVRSAHGARGFLYPIVDPQDIGRGGFEVLAVCHPDDDVVNSVIIAQKSKDVHANERCNGRGGQYARGAVPVVSPLCRFELTLYDPSGSSSGTKVACCQDFCIATHGGVIPSCVPATPCQYNISYGDGNSTTGFFVTDFLQYNQVSGNSQTTLANASITFGCGAKIGGDLGSSSQALDGILGFGQSNSSMLSQLATAGKVRKVFAHCLDTINGGGISAIGDVVQPKVSTTPLVPGMTRGYHEVNVQGLHHACMTLTPCKTWLPLAMLKPRFSSSLYSWHSAQPSQKKWTQQSMQGDAFKLYCDRIAERLVQEYNQLQPTHARQTYRVPFMQHAENKGTQPQRWMIFMFQPKHEF